MFFTPKTEQLDYARREGVCQANRQLIAEMGYAISIHQLLRQPGSQVPEHWAAAFELLFPQAGPEPRDPELVANLVGLGFTGDEAAYMVEQRRTNPAVLVTLVLAVMSGIPANEVWGVTHNV